MAVSARNGTLPSWLLVALILLFACEVQATARLASFFPRYFPDRNTDNGCKDHVKELTDSYEEASTLIDAAVEAIASVKQHPRPSFFHPKDKKDWDRKAQTVTAMFGVKISNKGGPEPESEENFKRVESIFNQMKLGLATDSVNAPWREPALYCGTDGWKFYKGADEDPQYPGHKIKDRILGGTDGTWYFNRNYVKIEDSTPTDSAICQPRVFASTMASASIITWCEYAWSKLAKEIQTKGIERYDHLDGDSRLSLSQTWVHELAHFYGGPGLPDQPLLDKGGKPIPKTKTYGIGAVLNLASHDSKAASNTADAYGWFAVAMHLSAWNWAKGFADS